MRDHLTDEQLRAWITAALPDADTAIVEHHLEQCRECAARLDQLEQATDPFEERVRQMAKDGLPHTADSSPTKSERVLERSGSTVGHYKLLDVIGEGGMGTVWLAQQSEPVKRVVALKIIKAGMDTREVIARFESERQALAVMDHPNIARVLDAGATDTGRPYFVMEHVKGIPITEFCDQNKTPPQRRLELFSETCSAIQHAHRKGIIHRDIKPSNILIALDDGVPIVKVIDFGLAKATGQRLTEKTLFTALGQLVGTPAYMSPEQAESSALDVDTRTDVYSLGVLLYELLTGVTPFDVAQLQKAGYAEMQRIIRDENPPTPSTRLTTASGDSAIVAEQRAMDAPSLVKMLRGDLDVIVMKALEKDRRRRYDSPNEFAADIRRFIRHEPIDARRASTLYRLSRMYQRKRTVFIAAGLVVASLLVGTITSTVLAFNASEAEELARDRLKDVEREKEKVTGALADSESARKKSDAVSQLMIDIFESPDPERQGDRITIVEMLDRAAVRMQTELPDQPARQADLRLVIARTYHSLRLNRKAAPLVEQVVDYRLNARGPEDETTQDAMLWLARCLTGQNRHDEAVDISEQVVRTRTKLYGPDDQRTLIARDTLATAIWRGGNAREQADRVLEIREDLVERAERTLGRDASSTLVFMNNLANSLVQLKRYDDALALRQTVLDAYTEDYGRDSPRTLHTLQVFIDALRKKGDPASALPIARELSMLSKSVLGETHLSTLRNMTVYADLLWQTEQRKESVAVSEQRLALLRKARGLHGPGVHQATTKLIERFGLAGQHEKALLLGREYIAGIERIFGADDPEVEKGLKATVRAIGGLPGANEKQLREALGMAERLVQRKPDAASYRQLQGIIRFRQADYSDALAALKTTAPYPRSLCFRAMSHWHLGEKDQARRRLEMALQRLEKNSSSDLWTQAAAREARELILSETPPNKAPAESGDARE